MPKRQVPTRDALQATAKPLSAGRMSLPITALPRPFFLTFMTPLPPAISAEKRGKWLKIGHSYEGVFVWMFGYMGGGGGAPGAVC